MINQPLIPLPGLILPADFPWRVGFIAAVDEHLRRLRATGHFVPSRFFGYYFRGLQPVAVSGSWTVTLDQSSPVLGLAEMVDGLTGGNVDIASVSRGRLPGYLLVHDRHDETCWLWAFEAGLRFVEATEPVLDPEDSGMDGAENRKLLEP
ncbi:MAG TPA: hypothetical protein VG710_01635 [Opitutus sp.]|nr:hypothetical protein [Opitutus sp.]